MIANDEYQQVLSAIFAADEAYYVHDEPIMLDGDYDELKRAVATMEAEQGFADPSSPTQRVSGRADEKKFAKVKHRQRMESLANSFSTDDISKWITAAGIVPGDEIIGELKMDGLSLSLVYENGKLVRAATRGDGSTGEDVTKQARMIEGLPLTIAERDFVEVRGECYMPRAVLQELNEALLAFGKKTIVNCRNGAAGSLRQSDPKITKSRRIRFMAFGVSDESLSVLDDDYDVLTELHELGFGVVPHFMVQPVSSLIATEIAGVAANRANFDFDIDGIVFKVSSRGRRTVLGSTSSAPRWATAYKFPPEQKTTLLKDIVVQVGRTGAQTPVAKLDPVFVGGVTVSSVTLHNEDEVNRLALYAGAKVIVQRAGDVIPQIVGLAPGEPQIKGFYTMPDTCVSCGGPTVRPDGEAVRRCVAGFACEAQLQGYLEHFVSRDALNIDGVGPAQLADMIRFLDLTKASQIISLPELAVADIRVPEAFYEDMLVSEAMEHWNGYGKSSVKKIMSAIKKARTPTLDRFIFALGIRNVGKSTSRDIAKHLGTVDAFFKAIEFEGGFYDAGIDKIDGIGPVVMDSIEDHFARKANFDEVFALRLAMEIKDMARAVDESLQVFKGETLCFTGGMTRWSREQALLIAGELGAKTTNSASKSVTILIAGTNVGAKKIEAAEKAGSRVMDEQWFIDEVEKAIALGYKLDVMD